jgi:alpha-L-fucosidase
LPPDAGRNFARKFVEAARTEGLPVGFYYSLMDWHHPDWLHVREPRAAASLISV